MEREKQEAWELAKQLVQIDSSDPGAYEEEIGLWITDWFKKQIADFGRIKTGHGVLKHHGDPASAKSAQFFF